MQDCTLMGYALAAIGPRTSLLTASSGILERHLDLSALRLMPPCCVGMSVHGLKGWQRVQVMQVLYIMIILRIGIFSKFQNQN